MNKEPKPNSSIEELSPEELKYALQYAREDLEDLQLYLEEFSAFLPLPIMSVNPLGFVLDVNKALEDLVGREQVEIIGESVEDFFLEKERFSTLQQKVLRDEYVRGEEITLLSKSGKVPISIYLAPRKDREDNVIGYFVGVFDVTKFKELEQALEDKVKQRTAALEKSTKELVDSRKALLNILEDVAEERGRAEEERDRTAMIIKNFADGLLVLEGEKVALLNPRGEKMLGIDGQEVVGKTIKGLQENPKIRPLLKLLQSKRLELFREELSLREDLVLEVSTTSVVRVGQEIGKMIILHDITREKMIEKMKTEFVSLAAHQLRTPLSAIKWTLKMILDGDVGKTTKEQEDLIEKAYQSNERMIILINDLLDVTRIEEGRYLYRPLPSQIEEITENIIGTYREEVKKRNIILKTIRPREKLPKVRVDVEKISLAIQNLVDNAVRYTPAGGTITVSLRHLVKENAVEFSIKDTGIGIPKDQQSRVYSKFFRGANAVRMETEGSGLGLYITKNIIETHGGKIWFESEENKGTTFYFTLPVKPSAEFEKFVGGF